MNHLILDFLRRWRWLFVIALLISVASGIAGFPFVFAPAGVVALLIDAQRGVFRAVRPLPVTRVEQARAWWLVGVPLLPLLSVPVLAIGVLLFQQFHPMGNAGVFSPPSATLFEALAPIAVQPERGPLASPQPFDSQTPAHRFIAPRTPTQRTLAPWFAAGVQAWVALGYAGFCFFLMQWAPIRAPENLAENVQQGVFGALWGISMPGVAFLIPALPRIPDAVATWHWVLFAAAPVFVALSYFSAAELVQRRMFVTTVKSRPEPAADARAIARGLTGVPLYVATFAGRIAIFVALIACVQVLGMRLLMRGIAPPNNPALVMQVALMGMAIGAVTAESVGMRALRALPLSTPKLALLLSLLPWAGAISGAAFSTLWCRSGDPALPVWVNFAAQSLAMCGWATLAFAITMHISGSVRLFVLMMLVMIPGAGLSFAAQHTVLFAAIGSAGGIAGFALLVRGLRKSSAFYRPRGFFGMTPGQPSAVR